LSACTNDNGYITIHDAIDNNHSEIHIKVSDIDSVCASNTGLYSLLKTDGSQTVITTKNTTYLVMEDVDTVMDMID
jgi:U3 small nucleolar ribonucleoprotein component